MHFQSDKIPTPRTDRQVLELFSEISESLVTLREVVTARGKTNSILSWFPPIHNCEEQIRKLFLAAYKAEATFRNPNLKFNQKHIDEL